MTATTQPQLFDIDCQLDYELAGPVDFLFQIQAINHGEQRVVSESLTFEPALKWHGYTDPTVNHRFVRVHAGTGTFRLKYQARVRLAAEPIDPDAPEVPIAELPDEVMHNLMPSRYCESDHLSRAAQRIFGGMTPGYARVAAISDWIHDNIEYQIGSSNPTTTARDVFVQRAGVCRDFAHLGVTFCRALNIPARLVVGYAQFADPPPDFHAMFEAYIGHRWVLFDPTRMTPVDQLVRIARGRDAKDVAFATIFGAARMTAMAPLVEPVTQQEAAVAA
jgi:transglutaminase-like putative cysteine protease